VPTTVSLKIKMAAGMAVIAEVSDCHREQHRVADLSQGVASPLFAKVYLHYVFDLSVVVWRKKVAKGDVIVVRCADDLVVGFRYRADAERFLREFRERLAKFGLELHADKTRLIEFGRFAARDRRQRGEGKPETFGFTHFCGQLTNGAFMLVRICAGGDQRWSSLL
jgi:RNA-directed DNA polymerase